MAGTKSNYSIITDVELDLKNAQQQLNGFKKNNDLKFDVGVTGTKQMQEADQAAQQLNESGKDLQYTYQQLRQVFDAVIGVISNMADAVKELDAAQTEFKKVSDLQGDALDRYTQKLSEAGKTVGRTGKPNRSEPVCCDGKAA